MFGCGTDAEHQRPFALVDSDSFTPALIIGRRFFSSSGETWPSLFVFFSLNRKRNEPEVDVSGRAAPSCPEARCARRPARLRLTHLIACESEEAQCGSGPAERS